MLKFEQELQAEAQLRSLSDVTIHTYVYRVKDLYLHYNREPAELSIHDIRNYFLHLINVKKLGFESLRNRYYSIRFYFVHCRGCSKETKKSCQCLSQLLQNNEAGNDLLQKEKGAAICLENE